MRDEIQQRQEDEYRTPYHWFDYPDSTKRRIYHGYIHLCLEKALGLSHEARILDAGCGDGRFVGHLRDQGFTHLFGNDYSERAITFARLMVPDAAFTNADLTSPLPWDTNTFDAIFLIETLEHIEPTRVETVLRNLAAVLKPGGILVISVPSVLQDMSRETKHYQHFSIQSLTHAVTPFFNITSLEGQNKHGFHPFKFLFRLLDNALWTIKPLTRWYNLTVWPRLFNRCAPEHGRRLIAVCEKPHL